VHVIRVLSPCAAPCGELACVLRVLYYVAGPWVSIVGQEANREASLERVHVGLEREYIITSSAGAGAGVRCVAES
jgi:hypothetical protein